VKESLCSKVKERFWMECCILDGVLLKFEEKRQRKEKTKFEEKKQSLKRKDKV